MHDKYLPQPKKKKRTNKPPSRQARRIQKQKESERSKFPILSSNLVEWLQPDKICEYLHYFIKLTPEERGTKVADPEGMQAFIDGWEQAKNTDKWKNADEKERMKLTHLFLLTTDLVKNCSDDGKLYLVTRTGYVLGVDTAYYFLKIKNGKSS